MLTYKHAHLGTICVLLSPTLVNAEEATIAEYAKIAMNIAYYFMVDVPLGLWNQYGLVGAVAGLAVAWFAGWLAVEKLREHTKASSACPNPFCMCCPCGKKWNVDYSEGSSGRSTTNYGSNQATSGSSRSRSCKKCGDYLSSGQYCHHCSSCSYTTKSYSSVGGSCPRCSYSR
tara:strand:- start:269 stop:787 length:519 start_codon:yes stop_codon:yes gene_type:complete